MPYAEPSRKREVNGSGRVVTSHSASVFDLNAWSFTEFELQNGLHCSSTLLSDTMSSLT